MVRENFYTDVGVVGRKTGLTVGAGLELDEDGMEDPSAFFSPPAARERFQSSPFAEIQNSIAHTVTSSPEALAGGMDMTGDDTAMEIDENSGRAPKDVLASRRKAPISPAHVENDVGEESPLDERQNGQPLPDSSFLNAPADLPDTSLSPHKPELQSQNLPRASSEALQSSPSPIMKRVASTKAGKVQAKPLSSRSTNKVAAAKSAGNEPEAKPVVRRKKTARSGALLVSSNRRAEAVQSQATEEFSEQELSGLDVVPNPPEKKKRKFSGEDIDKGGKRRRSSSLHDHQPTAQTRPRKGRTSATASQDKSSSGQAAAPSKRTTEEANETSNEANAPRPLKKKGRPPRGTKANKEQETVDAAPQPEAPESPVEEQSPVPSTDVNATSKGARRKNKNEQSVRSPIETANISAEPDLDEAEPSHGRRSHSNEQKKGKPGRKRKNVLTKDPSPAAPAPATDGNASSRGRKAAKVSASEPRQETVEVDDTGKRRSQRSRIAPLQFWKNERRIFTLKKAGSSNGVPSLVQQVLRVEDTPPKSKKRARKTKVSQGSNLARAQKEDTEELDDEEWEQSGGLVGVVKVYNPNLNDATGEEDQEEEEIAVSRHVMKPKAVFGSDYKFYKTLGKEFMGAGIIEMKPGSLKRMKTSGRMQLVFYIVSGKVEAVVNDLGFRIGTGSQFQVPRGNMYQISNPFDKTAKIFFAQACIPEGYSEGEN